ncbi:hypothetical protein JX265_006934 [Neoarthrinium moseri]|uniref:Azaphilone pigments biosynthesis cluster protein L N-terminal domain-containing protein n=1 Tax=Neoarthrinium moseri TaxID=1658444 RepID=A0A9Q0ALL5_9PEZI|nr:hypothetical protein JX265_006934 [Neoarthrinium moseri]
MDPVSLAASAAGLTSLGLQVLSGVTSYVDAFKSRDQDIVSIKSKITVLKNTIEVIRASSSNLQSRHPESVSAVTQNFTVCETALNALGQFTSKLSNDNTTTRDSLAGFKTFGKQIRYPLDRPKLKELTQRLDETIETLQLALQALGLDVTRLNTSKLITLERNLQTTSTGLQTVQTEIGTLNSSVEHIRDGMPDLQASIDSFGARAESSTTALAASIASHQRLHLSGLAVFQEQTVSNQRDVSRQLERIICLLNERLPEGVNTQRNQPSSGSSPFDTDRIPGDRVMRLAEKPDSLKQVCDAFNMNAYPLSESRNQVPVLAKYHKCSCNADARPRYTRQESWWGPIGLYRETQSTRHLPGCPMDGVSANDDNPHTTGFTFLGFRKVLRHAIRLSFTITSGAGGRSLGPLFTYYPTVDAETAPAFRVLKVLQDAAHSMGMKYSLPPDRFQMDTFLSQAITKLVRDLHFGHVSPVAVDSRNRNLMHIYAELVSNHPRAV